MELGLPRCQPGCREERTVAVGRVDHVEVRASRRTTVGCTTVSGELSRAHGALASQLPRSQFQGVFAEEREVLAVEALIRAGKAEAARARGERFLRAHPKSAHRVRLEELLR